MKLIKWLLPLLLTVLALFSHTANALTCKARDSVISETVAIDNVIKVSSSELKSGQKIWVSSPITATFTCSDTDSFPQGESAYLWLDPQSQASKLPAFIKAGVTFRGIDYPLENGKKVEIGPATVCNKVGNSCTSPATSQTFSLTYQVYIVATGSAVPADGKIADNLKLSLFQVDGVGGLRGGASAAANYNLYITGLSKISTMACVPTLNITPATVNFGTINAGNARPGYVEISQPFTIVYGLQTKGQGVKCGTENLLATFSTTNLLQESTVILPAANSGFGIILSSNSAFSPRIAMNTPEMIAVATGYSVTRNYSAGLLWLSRAPKRGEFTATTTITVTFQ